MQLIYKDEQIVLQRDETAMARILEKVSELIETEDIVFSHLVVDDMELYENHENYISEKINDIERVEIVTFKTKEMIWETLQSVEHYLDRAIPTLQETIDRSYEQFTEETWTAVSQLVEGLDWLLQFKTFTASAKKQPAGFDTFVETFKTCEEQFTPMLDAIEVQDTVLVTDILASKLLPAFKQLFVDAQKMLEDKDYVTDKN